jgi:hypothetical protein
MGFRCAVLKWLPVDLTGIEREMIEAINRDISWLAVYLDTSAVRVVAMIGKNTKGQEQVEQLAHAINLAMRSIGSVCIL